MSARARASTLLAGLVACALAGCGASGYAGHPPSAIVRDAVSAVADAHSFTATAVIAGRAPLTASLSVQEPNRIASLLSGPSARVQVDLIDSDGYVRADRGFWVGHGATALASQLSNRWFTVPATLADSLSGSLGDVLPGRLSSCLAVAMAKPSRVGTATIDGQAAVELHGAGGPGQNPGNLYVAVRAPHYPLAFDQTGVRNGGTSTQCGGSPTDSTGSSRLALTGWDATTVSTPAHAVPLPIS